MLAGSAIGEKPSTSFLLITNQRSVHIQGSYHQEIEHRDIVEVELATTNINAVVSIHSRASRLDFLPTDDRRLHHMIFHEVATPRQAVRIREVLELGRASD